MIETSTFWCLYNFPSYLAMFCIRYLDQLFLFFNYGQVMLGVDRLDMIKGIPQKILAFEKFLEENPSWRDKVVLIQIAVPTRTDVPECMFLPNTLFPRKYICHSFQISIYLFKLEVWRNHCFAALHITTFYFKVSILICRIIYQLCPLPLFIFYFYFADQKLTSQVHEIVGRINGRYGTLTTVPIHHLVCHGLTFIHQLNIGMTISKGGEKQKNKPSSKLKYFI